MEINPGRCVRCNYAAKRALKWATISISGAAMRSIWWISIAAIVSILSAPLSAQEPGSPQRGRLLAQGTCASCHGIQRGELSAHRRAPTFVGIANTRGMSPIALNVALLSSHKSMPNIVLNAQERADVIAYILSLKTR